MVLCPPHAVIGFCTQGTRRLILLDTFTRNRPTQDQKGPTNMEAYERLRQLISEAAEDISKAAGGNKAAGTRVRKIMQDIKQAAQEVRLKILEARQDD